jgi:molybdopterin/thiamine biosynthesis adenylyltransferase
VDDRARHRFSRQVALPQVGLEGQRRLAEAHAAVVGLGALGSSCALLLTRAGVGRLTLIDRDVVELHNLPRQSLFTEADAARHSPKAEVAARRLAEVDGGLDLQPQVADLEADNITRLLDGVAVVVDGTDNFETRYLINDWAVAWAVPWIYGGVFATEGLCLAVVPGRTPCLRCLYPIPPASTDLPSCESAGVWGPTVAQVAALQTSAALQLLLKGEAPPGLAVVAGWTGLIERLAVPGPDPGCPACGARRFEYLEEPAPARTVRPCTDGSIRIRPSRTDRESGFPPWIDLRELGRRLEGLVEDLLVHPSLVRFEADGCRMTVFRDGRAVVRGTEDPARARSLYDRYIGS